MAGRQGKYIHSFIYAFIYSLILAFNYSVILEDWEQKNYIHSFIYPSFYSLILAFNSSVLLEDWEQEKYIHSFISSSFLAVNPLFILHSFFNSFSHSSFPIFFLLLIVSFNYSYQSLVHYSFISLFIH